MKNLTTINDFKDKRIFYNLFQLYLYDLSKFNNNIEIEENGIYPASWIYRDWSLPEFIPLQIKYNQQTCGLILLTKKPFSKPGTDLCIQELFIMRKFRKKGIGLAAIKQLFKTHTGTYSMAVMKQNIPAKLFWEKSLNIMNIQYIKENYIEDGIDGFSYEFLITTD